MLSGALMCLLHTPIQSVENINTLSQKKRKIKEKKAAEWITDVNESLLYSFSQHSALFLTFYLQDCAATERVGVIVLFVFNYCR